MSRLTKLLYDMDLPHPNKHYICEVPSKVKPIERTSIACSRYHVRGKMDCPACCFDTLDTRTKLMESLDEQIK